MREVLDHSLFNLLAGASAHYCPAPNRHWLTQSNLTREEEALWTGRLNVSEQLEREREREREGERETEREREIERERGRERERGGQ